MATIGRRVPLSGAVGVGLLVLANSINPTAGPFTAQPLQAQSTAQFLYAANGDLWETASNRATQLTRVGHLTQPAVGPHDLVFVDREKSYSDVWQVDAAAARRVTHDGAAIVEQAHWAVEPTYVPGADHLYLLSDHDKSATGPGDLAIWDLDLKDRSFHQVTHPPPYTGGDANVAINPHDAQQIIFTRYTYGENGQLAEQLIWLDLRTKNPVELTPAEHPSRQAAFAPDGAHLAFIQTTGTEENLFVADFAVANGQAQLANAQGVASGTIAQPTWSPDGGALAYLALTDGQFQLWTISIERGSGGHLATGHPVQVTHGPGLDATSRPIWLTDDQVASIQAWAGRLSQLGAPG